MAWLCVALTPPLPADMKAGQAEKFLKARQDPSFARSMQIKDLSPQQAADQLRLRKVVQMTESRLNEVEAGIAVLKRRSDRRDPHHRHHQRATSSLQQQQQQPALERIQRTVRNVDVAIRDRQHALDELSRRIGGLKLAGRETRENTPVRTSTPVKTPVHDLRHASPTSTSATAAGAATPRRNGQTSGASGAPVSLEPTDAQRQRAATASKPLDVARSRLVQRAAAAEPVTRIGRASTSTALPTSSLVSHASVIRGPVKVDAVPLPGSVLPPPSRKGIPGGGSSSAAAGPSSNSGGASASSSYREPAAAAASSTFISLAPMLQAPATPQPQPPSQLASSSTSTSNSNPPTSSPSFGGGFAGIKLQLDPGTIVTGKSRGMVAGAAKHSGRHSNAVRLSTVAALPAGTVGGAPLSLFGDVALPAPNKDEKPAFLK